MDEHRWAHALAAGVAAALALTLTGCGGPAAPAGTEVPASVDPPAAVQAPTAAPEPEAHASCADLEAASGGATVAGAALAACYVDSLWSHDTARSHTTSGADVNDADLVFAPDTAIHGTLTDSEGTTEVVWVDDTAYRNEGDGWVRGDVDSEDGEEAAVGAAGAFLAGTFSREFIAGAIAACPVWNVQTGREQVDLPDSKIVQARAYVCAAPYTYIAGSVTDSTIWLSEDWSPVGSRSTATAMGVTGTSTQTFYDLGADIHVEAPM